MSDLLTGAEPAITLDDEIHCVQREIDLRARNYPRWVAEGRMAEGMANREISVMRAVLRRLKDARFGSAGGSQ